MGRGDLTDEEWERLRPFLPVSNRRCGRWRDHRKVIDGILHRVRTGVQWRDIARVAVSHSRTCSRQTKRRAFSRPARRSRSCTCWCTP
ncbi:transposase [Streptomyces sp. G7(2002)]|uniref:transposase n=1 Tax=Streptomyces sp. G7(2002) TaxID=2971798 RepID=UPI00237D3FBE|nr:transposase [Streptomyces sp. G7(2002)]WDT52728.1 transposase [Streptomyces sp. G7(2002)]